MTLSIQLNGATVPHEAPLTITDLLKKLSLVSEALAVAINGEIIPRAEHASRQIRADDQVELIRPTGGG